MTQLYPHLQKTCLTPLRKELSNISLAIGKMEPRVSEMSEVKSIHTNLVTINSRLDSAEARITGMEKRLDYIQGLSQEIWHLKLKVTEM